MRRIASISICSGEVQNTIHQKSLSFTYFETAKVSLDTNWPTMSPLITAVDLAISAVNHESTLSATAQDKHGQLSSP
jgi:hypothetical protein